MNILCESCKEQNKNVNNCVNFLEKIHFPIQNRKESDIPNILDLQKIHCKYKKLKYCICALRRGKVEYWNLFDEIVTTNISELSITLSPRWIVSVCDTYIDYGNEEEKSAAIAISTLNFSFILTNSLYHGKDKIDPKSNIVIKNGYVNYDTSFMFKKENDFFENFLKRFLFVIKRSKKIYPLGLSFLNKHKSYPNSLFFYIHKLNKNKFPDE